jgi:hypothetical protein
MKSGTKDDADEVFLLQSEGCPVGWLKAGPFSLVWRTPSDYGCC